MSDELSVLPGSWRFVHCFWMNRLVIEAAGDGATCLGRGSSDYRASRAERRAYSIGPFWFPAGDSELAFRGLEPAIRLHDVEGSDDARPLTVMFGVWNWIAADAGS